MRLILTRHAKSDWTLGIDTDHARPLNARGERSATAIGDWLRAQGHVPDQVLCSSATRTRQTLDLMKVDAPVRFEDRLYHASSDVMLDSLQSAEGETVLMIGHNPGIAEFAARLLSRSPQHNRFGAYPTCATLVADFDLASWSDLRPATGKAIDFIVPRELI